MSRIECLIAAILRYFHNQETADNSESQSETDPAYDDRQSISPFIKEEQRFKSLSHQGKSEKHEENAAHQRELVMWTRRLAYTTGALALATFIVACFAGWQAWEMRTGADQQHIDTLAALGKTDQAIAATNKLADAAVDQATAGRAHVWVQIAPEPPDMGDNPTEINRNGGVATNQYTILFKFVNYGLTPAIITNFVTHLFIYYSSTVPNPTDEKFGRYHESFVFPPDNAEYFIGITGGRYKNIGWTGPVQSVSSGQTVQVAKKFVFNDPKCGASCMLFFSGNAGWAYAVLQYKDVFGINRETGYFAKVPSGIITPEAQRYNYWK